MTETDQLTNRPTNQPTFRQALAAIPWDLVALIGRTHGLGIDQNLTKVNLIERVATHLADSARLEQTWAQLPPPLRQPLLDLRHHGGRCPQRHLTRRHGGLRPPRPLLRAHRRRETLTLLEQLQVRGLLFADTTADLPQLYLPAELIPHLPPPASAHPRRGPAPSGHPAPVQHLILDLTLLVALLQRDPSRPWHDRWLPPRLLAEWGRLTIHPPTHPQARGELQTGRRRFLHYLAESAGFVSSPWSVVRGPWSVAGNQLQKKSFHSRQTTDYPHPKIQNLPAAATLPVLKLPPAPGQPALPRSDRPAGSAPT